MIVLLEGVNRSGKSTLAGRLEAELGAEVVHFTGPARDHALLEYGPTFWSHDPLGRPLVVDRAHWSEWAYSMGGERRPSTLTGTGTRYLDAVLDSRGGVAVLCEADPADVRLRLLERDSRPGAEDPQLVSSLYAGLARRTRLPVVKHRIEAPLDLDALVDLVARRARAAAEVVGVTGEVVGPTRPTGLLVGDRIQGSRSGALGIPVPLAPVHGTSGDYLLSAMAEGAGGYALTNASVQPLEALWRSLGSPAVAALGNAAHARLESLGVPHGVAPHPQYVRRFWHSGQSRYKASVERALDGADERGRWREADRRREAS